MTKTASDAESKPVMNQGNQIHFRQVDWSAERPRLFHLLKELELNEDLAGIIIWRDNQPYVLATSELAMDADRLNRACNTENGITDRQLRQAILALPESVPNGDGAISLADLLEEATEENPFDTEERLAHILWRCGLERSDHEAILSWILLKFPKAAKRLAKDRQKYHF